MKFEIGTDVWAVSPQYRPALIRGHIVSFGSETDTEGYREYCYVKPFDSYNHLRFASDEIFPVATDCHAALCRLDSLKAKVFYNI